MGESKSLDSLQDNENKHFLDEISPKNPNNIFSMLRNLDFDFNDKKMFSNQFDQSKAALEEYILSNSSQSEKSKQQLQNELDHISLQQVVQKHFFNPTPTNLGNLGRNEKENRKQRLLIVLLKKVCSFMDPTPSTFLFHCLKLFQEGIIDDLNFLVSGNEFPNPLSQSNLSLVKSTKNMPSHCKDDLFDLEWSNHLVYSRFQLDFRILEIIDTGGFGKIYKALHNLDNRVYAIKQILFTASNASTMLQRKVLREVQCWSKLDHQYVCRYFNAWIEPAWEHKHITPHVTSNHKIVPHISPIPSSPLQILNCNDKSKDIEDSILSPLSHQPLSSLSSLNSNSPKSFLKDQTNISALPSFFTPTHEIPLSTQQHSDDIDKVDPMLVLFEEEDIEINENDNIVNGRVGGFDNRNEDTMPELGTPVIDGFMNSVSPSVKFDQFSSSSSLSDKDNLFSPSLPSLSQPLSNLKLLSISPSNPHLSVSDRVAKVPAPLIIPNESIEPHYQPKNTEELMKEMIENINVPIFLYIQSQYCNLGTLSSFLFHRKSIDRIVLMQIFFQILSGLSHIHDHQIYHRDLKPSNIYLYSCSCSNISNASNQIFCKKCQIRLIPPLPFHIKIGDFGLAKETSDAIQSHSECIKCTPLNLEHTGQLGTASYVSPEQLNSLEYNHLTDIFSLGLILYEMFHIFHTEMERIICFSRVKKGEIENEMLELYPIESKLILKMTQHDYQHRPSCFELLNDPYIRSFSYYDKGQYCHQCDQNVNNSLINNQIQLELQKSQESNEEKQKIIEQQNYLIQSLQEQIKIQNVQSKS